MWERFTLRMQSLSARYGDAAPVVCCGVCKTCVTTAATGLVVGAAGSVVGVAAGRRSRGENSGPLAGEAARELGEDRHVGVQPAPLDATDADSGRRPLMLEGRLGDIEQLRDIG